MSQNAPGLTGPASLFMAPRAGPVVIGNAALVLPDRVAPGGVVIKDGLIAEVFEGAAPAGALDWGGDLLVPGLVELHTDNLEHHLLPRPGVEWPRDQAILAHDVQLAGCGITTVFDALRVGSIRRLVHYRAYAREVASRINALADAGALRINHLLHLRAEICSETLTEELDQFTAQDRVRLVSIMDHTPGQRQFRDPRQYARWFTSADGVNEAALQAHIDMMQDIRARFGAGHEAAILAAADRLGAVLASHDDTTEAEVAGSAAHGVRIAEFPTTELAARACRAHGIATMAGAPNLIRGGSHTGNIAAVDLARAGLLDILSSDYVPASLLSGAMQLAELWDDLPRALACVSDNPARAAGLADRGRIAPGLRADLIRLTRQGGLAILRETWVGGARVA